MDVCRYLGIFPAVFSACLHRCCFLRSDYRRTSAREGKGGANYFRDFAVVPFPLHTMNPLPPSPHHAAARSRQATSSEGSHCDATSNRAVSGSRGSHIALNHESHPLAAPGPFARDHHAHARAPRHQTPTPLTSPNLSPPHLQWPTHYLSSSHIRLRATIRANARGAPPSSLSRMQQFTRPTPTPSIEL
jgi:hypothetical protein